MKIKVEFKIQDAWIGVFWKRTVTRQVCHCGDYCDSHAYGNSNHGAVPVDLPDLMDIWICIVPCFPIHITMDVNPL